MKTALAATDQGLRAEPSWRFRLLKAEVLIANRRAKDALAVLDSPDDGITAPQRARLAMDRASAETFDSRFSDAESDLKRATEIAQSAGDGNLQGEIGLKWALLRILQGRPAEAEELLRGVLATAAQYKDASLDARASGNLGLMFLNTFRYDGAIYWFEKVQRDSEKLGLASSTARAIGNLGSCYYRIGDYDRALANFAQAEQRFKKLDNLFEQQVWLGNVGNVLHDQAHYAEAAEKYKQALDIAQTIKNSYWTSVWLGNLALASINLKDFDSAEKYNRESMALKQKLKSPVVYARLNEARIAGGKKDYEQAEKMYRDLITAPTDDPTPVLEAETSLADVLVERGELDRADEVFRSAIEQIEGLQSELKRDDYKVAYLARLVRFYRRYVDFLVTRGQAVKALEVVESSRARLLDQSLHSRGAPSVQNESVRVTDLQKFAKASKSVLLSYWVAKQRSFFWVVTPDSVTMHELPVEEEIEPLVSAYRGFIENLRDPLGSEFGAAKKLSQMLLGPVRPLLTPGVRLIIVPDLELHSINFETLPDPDDNSRYLIERVTVAIAPSLRVLTDTKRNRSTSRSILLVGNPEPAGEEFPRLPYAAQEMSRIEQSFPLDNRVVMEGAEAYPAAYRDSEPGRFSWIHFAAHATANRENPLDSALILSRRGSVYALSARDVMNVPLNADLVTLSACRSAGAKAYSGEGLVGLSWAFLRAGAKSVVAGLWDVTDLSTSSLMADFYTRLVKDMPAAEALREAKLEMIHSKGVYHKPFYWGPFQLYVGSGN